MRTTSTEASPGNRWVSYWRLSQAARFTLQLGPKPGEWGDETIGGARAGVIPWPLADGSVRFAAVLGGAR